LSTGWRRAFIALATLTALAWGFAADEAVGRTAGTVATGIGLGLVLAGLDALLNRVAWVRTRSVPVRRLPIVIAQVAVFLFAIASLGPQSGTLLAFFACCTVALLSASRWEHQEREGSSTHHGDTTSS
jgi:hypothetical protein